MSYIINTPKKKIMLTLFETEETEDYSKGQEYDWSFNCDEITLEGLKKKYLKNTGILALEGASGDSVLVTINMMVMVSEEDGELYKKVICDTQ